MKKLVVDSSFNFWLITGGDLRHRELPTSSSRPLSIQTGSRSTSCSSPIPTTARARRRLIMAKIVPPMNFGLVEDGMSSPLDTCAQ